MAVHKLRHIIDDIATDFKQTFDDKQVQKTQIGFAVLMVGNRLKSQHIQKRDSGAFLSTYTNVPVQIATTSQNPNLIAGRKHIVLPTCIYDYHNDAGINYMSYFVESDDPTCLPRFTMQTFQRTTPAKAETLYYSEYTKPSPKNPYFYRIGDYIYFLGIECVNVKAIEIGIFSTFDPITEIDIDMEFEFPEELLVVLKRHVIDLIRFNLLVPEQRLNDGIDKIGDQNIPTNKVVSVNDPVNTTQNEQ